MTPDSLPFDSGKKIPVANLAETVLNTPGIEGITISGGEPFAQVDALNELLNLIKSHKDLGVIIYSGYTLANLRKQAQSNTAVDDVLRNTDLLIDGPYIAARDDGLSLRGSSNQHIHTLTARYTIDSYAKARREVEIHVRGNDVMLVGIAGKETRRRWQNAKHRLHV